MSQSTSSQGEDLHGRETLEPGSTDPQRGAGSESSDSDFEVVGGKSQDTGNQGPSVESNQSSPPTEEEILHRLKTAIIVEREGLQKIYGKKEGLDRILKAPAMKGEEMAEKLMREMRCPREVAKDLTVLTLYNVAILIDDSDSMIYEEEGRRRETLIEFVDYITDIYSLANQSGILAMRFINGHRGKKGWTKKSKDYLSKHSYGGMTRIGTALKEKILDLFVIGNAEQSKPLLVLIVTDGAVEGERKSHLGKVIRDCVNEREGAGKGFDAVSFQFSRIGNDLGAKQLLIDLDEDPKLGDYIDVLPIEFDLEGQLEEDKWFVLPKILLGAILPAWDKEDGRSSTMEADHLAKRKDREDAKSKQKWEDSDDE